MADEKKLDNIECLIEFRLKGKAIAVGEVIPKTAFGHRSEWNNLANMTPARVKETGAAVGKPKKSAKKDADLPGVGA